MSYTVINAQLIRPQASPLFPSSGARLKLVFDEEYNGDRETSTLKTAVVETPAHPNELEMECKPEMECVLLDD